MFSVGKRKDRKGRNPKTGKETKIAAKRIAKLCYLEKGGGGGYDSGGGGTGDPGA